MPASPCQCAPFITPTFPRALFVFEIPYRICRPTVPDVTNAYARARGGARGGWVKERKQMSLDEYEAVLAEKKAALNKKAAEKKVNMDEFKGLKTYVRVETSDEITGVELSKHKEAAEKVAEEVAEVAEKVSKKKTTLETSFKYDAPEPTREGGRGGRGEGRGGRGGERRDRGGRGEGGRGGRGGGGGRGGDRPAPSSAPRAAGAGRAPAMGSLAIDDASAFPSLA
eukprot:gene2459-8777_t